MSLQPEVRHDGDVEVITYLGWWWNPFDLHWEAQVGPHRWLIATGYDLDSLPRYSPHQLTA